MNKVKGAFLGAAEVRAFRAFSGPIFDLEN